MAGRCLLASFTNFTEFVSIHTAVVLGVTRVATQRFSGVAAVFLILGISNYKSATSSEHV